MVNIFTDIRRRKVWGYESTKVRIFKTIIEKCAIDEIARGAKIP